MLPGRLVSCVARVSTHAADMEVSTEAPTRLTAGAWTEPSLLDDAAERLAAEPVEVYWLRVDQLRGSDWMAEEVAMVARLVRRAGIPVVASCTSAVFAMQVLTVPRIALVNPRGAEPYLWLVASRRESADRPPAIPSVGDRSKTSISVSCKRRPTAPSVE